MIPCQGLLPHFVGVGDNICERCGINIHTWKFPLPCPYKRNAGISEREEEYEIIRHADS